jgi:hypothetical protein
MRTISKVGFVGLGDQGDQGAPVADAIGAAPGS